MIYFENVLNKLKSIFFDVHFLIILATSVLIFILQYNNLSLPYFSDELWSYGPAVRKASVFGPSLLPSSLALEDHWGHPLLFFFISGSWGVIFGASLFSTHLFASLLSMLLLLVMYFVIKSLMSIKIAFFSTLIFASQSIFLGQFALVLPEVLLTIFFFLTIYSIEKKQYIWYVLFGSCLVLTKESGVFLIGAIGLWNIIKDIFYSSEKKERKSIILKYILLSLPTVPLIIHFFLLKLQYGWYIIPVRVSAFELSWDILQSRLMSTIHYVFIYQGRKVLTITLFFIGVLFYDKFSWKKRIIVIAFSFVMTKVFFRYWKMPELIEFTLIPLGVLFLFKTLFWDLHKQDKNNGGVIAIFSIVSFFYIIFISSFFDSRRYLFYLIPPFIITTVYFISEIKKFQKFLLPIFTIIAIASSFNFQYYDINSGDDTIHYTNLCKIQRDAIRYLETNHTKKQLIQTSFLFKHALERPLTGYLNSNDSFSNVKGFNSGLITTKNTIFIFVNTELPVFYNDKKSIKNLVLIKEFKKRNVWIKIYKS